MTATLNIFILHYEQIKQCVRGDMGFDDCNTSLLTFYYTATWDDPVVPRVHARGEVLLGRGDRGGLRRDADAEAEREDRVLAHVIPCVGHAAPVVGMVLRGNCYEYEVRSSHTGSHTTASAW